MKNKTKTYKRTKKKKIQRMSINIKISPTKSTNQRF
jgi:hypothetical protein